MLVPNFPFRNKLLQTHVKSIETGCPVNCFLSRAPNRAPMRVFFLACRAPNRAPMRFFFTVCRAPNRAPMRVFFLRFVVRQIVLQCVFFFAVCRAPNRAPMRAFIRGLLCAKSCCMVSIMLKVRALVIIFFVLWKWKKCGKTKKSKNLRFCIVFLFGA